MWRAGFHALHYVRNIIIYSKVSLNMSIKFIILHKTSLFIYLFQGVDGGGAHM